MTLQRNPCLPFSTHETQRGLITAVHREVCRAQGNTPCPDSFQCDTQGKDCGSKIGIVSLRGQVSLNSGYGCPQISHDRMFIVESNIPVVIVDVSPFNSSSLSFFCPFLHLTRTT